MDTTAPTTTTVPTSTTVEPVDALAVIDRAIAKFDELFSVPETVAVIGTDGWYEKADIDLAYQQSLDSRNPNDRPHSAFIDKSREMMTILRDRLLEGLVSEDGRTFRFHVDSPDADDTGTDYVALFSNAGSGAISIDATSFFFNSSEIRTEAYAFGFRISFDPEGNVSMESTHVGPAFFWDSPRYTYFRYVEDQEYLAIYDDYLCDCFELTYRSFDDAVQRIYSTSMGYGRETDTYTTAWTDPETGDFFATWMTAGELDSVSIKMYHDVRGDWTLFVHMNPHSQQWEVRWNLIYASGWSRLHDDPVTLLYLDDDPVFENAHFESERIWLSYWLFDDAATFSDNVLNLTAYGLVFEGEPITNAILEAKMAYALLTAPSMTTILEIDLHAGDPYVLARSLLPAWVAVLAEEASNATIPS
ncbi:MAG: hypothetical protein Q8N15_04665, partial [Bacillota bacterium]|nr:hypothetical protein [Bacillota bacterium]